DWSPSRFPMSIMTGFAETLRRSSSPKTCLLFLKRYRSHSGGEATKGGCPVCIRGMRHVCEERKPAGDHRAASVVWSAAAMSTPAPVALFPYARPEHTRITVESLAANELAKGTKIFIFSDAARSEQDVEAVNAVRRYLRGIKGFRDVNVVERSRNYGLA